MISLEQIKQLESRVHSAVDRIRTLAAENTTLKESLASYEQRIDELEKVVSELKLDQQEIEAGILAALSQLDGLEDAVAESGSKPAVARAVKAESHPVPKEEVDPAMAPESVGAEKPHTAPLNATTAEPDEPESATDSPADEAANPDTGEAQNPDSSADGRPESDEGEPADEEEPELDIF